ncbi:minor capsid protein [Kroppenstedtia sanguinis]|uniref:Minor capsid protein n=1 Tax=Kroppenstedtia sanguinis TaxID=1380684 RepID=A0ABW4C484_9BACL
MKHMSVKIDLQRIKPKMKKATNAAVGIVTQQVVKDSNLYAPMDTGNLINSSLSSSDFPGGKAVWNTPYARRLYYGTSFKFAKDKNPRAQALWYEKAKAVHLDGWVRVAQRAVEKGI